MQTMRKLQLLAFAFFAFASAYSQVTTSSINGNVSDSVGTALDGATIVATHQPSGTIYTTISGKGGFFNIANARIGGPYQIKIDYVGYNSLTLDGIFLSLGEPYTANALMGTDIKSLSTLIITGRQRKNTIEKTGASTNIGSRQIMQLPTINRSITDFTRLTPQANGNSFGGRDGRYNNVQVDGANFNNGFGLNDNPLPGGGGLSLDAIEEIQVNIAPYDVRQGGFTGAGINAVTRSGTNTFSGSAYYYFRHQGITGHKVNGAEIDNPKSSSKTQGFRLGGPIIKNKLFFFVNAEKIDNGGVLGGAVNLWKASEDGIGDESKNIAKPTRSDLEAVRNHLIDQWGYDPGTYEGYATNTEDKTTSLLARIDWNISKNHKLAIRYNQVENNSPQLVNNNSGPSPRSSIYRVSAKSMAFENTMYFTANKVNSVTLELNSKLSSRLSNQLLATYSRIYAGRASNSAEFPMIDIGDGTGTSSSYVNYISAGYELFSYHNEVKNDNYNFFDNLTYVTNKHNFTFGASFEIQKFANGYLREGTSYYRYASVEDFLKTGTPDEVAPIQFGLTYPYPGQEPFSKVKYALPAAYIQDKISFTKDFSLTLGLRAEIPFFMDKLTPNTAVDNLELLDVNGAPKYYTTKWPKTRIMLSPRIGFRWNVEGDKSLILRGGTGIFAGRVPFVWLTNMPSNLGVIQNTVEPGGYAASAAWIGDIRFNPDKYYWLDHTPSSAQDVFIKSPTDGVPSSLALVDNNFKMPQVWRSSIGFDKTLGSSPVTLTADFIFTKDLQSVYQFGANRKPATQHMSYAGDTRDFYPNSDSYTYNNALGGNSGSVLTNTRKGYSMNLSVGLSLPVRNGLFGSIFYSGTLANTTTDNPGSNASSAWGNSPNINSPNDLLLYSSEDALPHRIVGNISYRIQYLKFFATTLSLYYNGAAQGRYSYGYVGDLNGDGIAADLLYIPESANEINFAPITGSTPFTVEQQRAAFDAFIDHDKYLSKRRGMYAERNGALLPWLHRFDFKLLQDIFANIGKQKNTLQFSIDIINFGNLLNSHWGVRQEVISGANTLLRKASITSEGVPTFTMNTVSVNGQTILPATAIRDVTTTATTWGMQIGLRYIFN